MRQHRVTRGLGEGQGLKKSAVDRSLAFLVLALGIVLALSVGQLSAQQPKIVYLYDDLGRLVQVVNENNECATYEYDAVGNILKITRSTTCLAAPTITSLSQDSARTGETACLTITGNNFLGATVSTTNPEVHMSGVRATETSIDVCLAISFTAAIGVTHLIIGTPGGVVEHPFRIDLGGLVLRQNTTIRKTDLRFDGAHLTIEGPVTVTIDGSHQFASLTLQSGAVVTHPAATVSSTSSLDLTIDGTLRVDATSRIDMGGQGFFGGRSGSNADAAGQTLRHLPGSGPGSGGSYGGLGGQGAAGSTVGAAYGDLQHPTLPGSGGGGQAGSASVGGHGGGVVRLAAHEIVLDGAILANGTAGSGPNGGGGSGGSVLMTTAKLIGTGRVEANGGGVVDANSGTGGGGRIALLVADLSGFDPAHVRATGGTATLTGGEAGGAGTILVKEAGQTDGSLIVDNRGIGGALTPLRSVGFGRTTALTATVLTDPAASFPVPDPTTGAAGLIGLRVNPNLIQGQTFPIVDNAGTTLTITEGDLTTVAEPGTLYLGVYTFDDLTVAGGARLVTADAVSVRVRFSIDATSSLTSHVELRNILVPILTTASGTTRPLTVTLPAAVAVPTTVVAVSGNPGIAAITASAVIPAGQTSVDLAVTGESSGETPVIMTAGTQIRVIRVAVDVPPVGTPVLASSPVLALVAPAVLDTVTVGVGGTTTVTLTLGTPAPAGGLTATVLSQNPEVATVVSPIAIGEGAQTLVVELTGVAPGETTVVVQAGEQTFVLRVLVGVSPPVPTVVSPVVEVHVLSLAP